MNYSHRHFLTIDSTSLYLKENFDDVTNLTFVSSDYQSKGKGRNDRKWFSPIGENLLFSFIIKDKELIEKYNLISIFSAYVMSLFFKNQFNVDTEIKWPNDVYINGKKVTGILLESHMSNNEMDGLIIGIGTNMNQTIFPDNLLIPPTSIKLETGFDVDINYIKDELFSLIVDELNLLKKGNKRFLDYVRNHNYLKNKTVTAFINNEQKEVEVIDINDDCTLKVKCENNIYNLFSGEVTFHSHN